MRKLNIQEFIEKAIAIHGDKYGYELSKYINIDTKIQIFCKFHDEYFWQTPYRHINSNGCPKCGKLNKSDKQRKTQKQFIEEAFAIHGDKYEYSQSEYIDSKTKIQILCKFHNEYFWQTPHTHLNGTGCPKCGMLQISNKLRKTQKQFIEEAFAIHGDKYGYELSKYVNIDTKVQIFCKFHDEYFWQTPYNHLNGGNCPKCSKLDMGNKLRKTQKQFITESFAIHGDKYGYELSKYTNSNSKIQIFCKFHDKYFWQTPYNHINGNGCPKCGKLDMGNKQRSTTKQFIKQAKLIHGDKYKYDEVNYADAKIKVKIICKKHGIFEQTPNGHLNGRGCPKCTNIISILEIEVQDFIKSLDFNIKENNREIIKPLELDIYIIDHNIAIEFNGLFYHDENHHDKNFHLMKTLACEKLGIQLIHIFEDEWLFKQEIVKSRLLNLLGLTPTKIFARKCIIKEVSNKESREFLENNHIQGNSNSKIRLGLFYNDELVSFMTFGTLRKNLGSDFKEDYYELTRFCNLINTNVMGGANKLLKHFVKTYQPKQIISYADRRWSQGKLYEKLGFDFIHDSAPSYFYIIGLTRKNRFLFRKDILIKEGFDANKTEHEIMLERKIYRIYDCGAKKYLMNF